MDNKPHKPRRTEDERIAELNSKIAAFEKQKKDLLKTKSEKTKKAISREHFSSPSRTERTHRLIEKGALAEKYFQQYGTVADFAKLLDEIVSRIEIQIIIDRNKIIEADETGVI